MIRTPKCAVGYFILLSFSGLTLFAPPLSARGTRVEHGHMRVELPGAWQLRKGKTLTATSRTRPNAQVLFVAPVPATIAADAYLRKGVAGFEKNRKILKTYPARPKSGKTRGGIPYTFWSVTSQGARGDVRFGTFYAFKLGSKLQTVILLAGDQATFKAEAKPVGNALDRLTVIGNPGRASGTNAGVAGAASNAPIRPLRGRAYPYYDHVLQAPAQWKATQGRIGGERVFSVSGRHAGFKTYGVKDIMKVAVEIQPVGATDPAAALRSYLTNRADLGQRRIRLHKIRRWNVYGQRQGTLSSGKYAGFVMEYNPENRILLAGVALVRPDSSSTLLIGSGLFIHEYDNKYKGANVNADRNHWMKWYNQMLGMAASVRWTATPGRNQGRETWLAQKRTLRYSKSSSVSSGSVSAVFSAQADWNFGGDGSVKYKVERVRSFLDNSYDLYGRPDFSSGYAGNESAGRVARYQVRSRGRQNFLTVRYPSGAASVHNLSFSPFAIDGYRDGCCR